VTAFPKVKILTRADGQFDYLRFTIDVTPTTPGDETVLAGLDIRLSDLT
jgi:hypothetical protein